MRIAFLNLCHTDPAIVERVANKLTKDPYFDMYMFGEAQLYFYDYRCDDVLDSIYNIFITKNM